ncbi:MAG: response regulator [Planctomycetaceae bacterium]|nr:response regulator [Planctomycetaceae bacterium]
MSERTILVIDDSATIRRLVDATLSPVGYRVVLAGNAEEGLERAAEIAPDLIILDHQLPGTTGKEVCKQLLANPDLKDIPIVGSSTLRKRAYVEYADCPNVVDMLPKPYTAELLITTVANTVDTGALIVDSQREGTAVPEVIDEVGQSGLSGSFECCSIRELLDFLNNGDKTGVLEVELAQNRVWIYLAKGRVQAVTANGIEERVVLECLPESLQDLAPVLKLTLAGGSCSQIDGLVQLLDNKVLDPRLLRKLLRHQASMLLLHCFRNERVGFRFEAGREPPSLHHRLQLDISVIALLVEAVLRLPSEELPADQGEPRFVRRAIRGQNLDRAGLSAQHQKIVSCLGDAISVGELSTKLGWDHDQVHRVLIGFEMADLVERQVGEPGKRVVVLETDTDAAMSLREAAQENQNACSLKVVRDRLSLQLVLKRHRPDVIVIAVDSELGQQVCRELREMPPTAMEGIQWIGIYGQGQEVWGEWDQVLHRPYAVENLYQAVNDLPDVGAKSTFCVAGS